MKYRTQSLQQAAALLAQSEFRVDYLELEATEKSNIFKFLMEVHSEKDVFDEWVSRYTNQRTMVEPKNYDAKINLLRDNLTLQKSRG